MATIVVAQQQKILQAKERMNAMREMILALEHTQENPLIVEDESEGETVVSNGVELEMEENKVAILILPLGRLIPIKDMSWGPAFGQLPLCLSLQPKQPSARYSIWLLSDSNP